ncbi:MAG: NAD(+) synthase, partial [Endomicrobium sp.]|nr:NAD(+) synthase [Endomicrobium sp.]
MKYGFIRVAAATPKVTIANPGENAKEIINIIKLAKKHNIELLVFPELCLTGYSCGELFLSEVILHSVSKALDIILKSSIDNNILIFLGTPIYINDKLYSCAVALQDGHILGVVPKTFIPSYSEFYETRYFTSGKDIHEFITLCQQKIYFGTNILFNATTNNNIKIAAEICEDMFVINPPSNEHAKAGASIIVNLSASNELIGKTDYRRILIMAQSGRLICGYIYTSAGSSEAVNDMVFSGHKIIAENGSILNESYPFNSGLLICELDIDKLAYERRRINVFKCNPSKYHIVQFKFNTNNIVIKNPISPFPFIIPQSAESILQIQAKALAEKLHSTKLKAVIGISGGLDSCLALLVILRSYKILRRKKRDIIAITMPGPGTKNKTRQNVIKLANATGIQIRTINICKSVFYHLRSIGHSQKYLNNVYENAQSRERTQILMDVANAKDGIVIGTGNLSENALGWCTYNGDHMSMYSVNASIPRTVIRYLVDYESNRIKAYKNALVAILNTKSSPELLPTNQSTENIIGEYELHDFFLYHMIRFGQAPNKT